MDGSLDRRELLMAATGEKGEFAPPVEDAVNYLCTVADQEVFRGVLQLIRQARIDAIWGDASRIRTKDDDK